MCSGAWERAIADLISGVDIKAERVQLHRHLSATIIESPVPSLGEIESVLEVRIEGNALEVTVTLSVELLLAS